MATVFLFVGVFWISSILPQPDTLAVAILDAGRTSLSLFLLLIVSLGLSVVKESLGPQMTRCWLLAVAHFVFGGVHKLYTPVVKFDPSPQSCIPSALWS